MPRHASVLLLPSKDVPWVDELLRLVEPLTASVRRLPANTTPPPASEPFVLVIAGPPAETLALAHRLRPALTPDAPPTLLVLDGNSLRPEERSAAAAGTLADSLLLWPCDPAEIAAQLSLLARLAGRVASPAPAGPALAPRAALKPSEIADRALATFVTSDVGTWHWSVDSDLVVADANLARFFGLDPDQKGIPVESFLSRVHPADRDRVRASVDETLRTRRDFDEEYRVIRPDGVTLWVHARGRMEGDAEAGPLLFAGVALDITARRAALSAWIEAEQRFRALQEATLDGFMIYHALRDEAGEIADFECRFANAAAERIIGLGPRAGARLLVDQPGVKEDGLFDDYVRVVRERKVWRREFHYTHEGIDGWFRCTAVPAGEGFAISFTDVTDLKRAEQRAEEEHALLEAVLEACPAGIVFAAASGELVRVNSANKRLWGPTPRSRSVEEYREWKGWWADGSARHGLPLAPGEWAMARALRGETQSAGDLVDIEPFDTPGTRRTVINHGAPVRDRAGKIVGAVVVQTDVTEWRQAQRELRRSEERFRRLAESMPQLVWVADEQGQVTYYNNRAAAFSGIRPRADGGWDWQPVLHPDDEAATVEAWRHAVATGSPYQAEHRLRMADGAHRWHLSRAYAFDGPDGRRQWFGTATDIHEQKHQQEILEHTVQQRTASLQTALAELETFSYSLAHDMRAPLRALTGFAQLLLEDHAASLDAAGQDMLRRIAAAGGRMDQLIRDVLCYSTVARSEAPLQPVALRPLLDGILETYATLRERGAEVSIEDPLPAVQGNEAMLMQVFSNLLTNAVKFTPPERRPSVRIFARDCADRPGRVRLHVQDNGMGIAPEHHARIFQIFQRLNAAYEGTGIGLSVVQKATERMGGRVGVESARGHGATFWVELRRADGTDA